MAQTISQRLAESARTSFVGREKELSLLQSAIKANELPFIVAYIHGIGGIGKTRLLQAALSNLDPEITSIKLDCREIEPTQKGFLEALGKSLNSRESNIEVSTVISKLAKLGRRTVLALDTYETFGLMDTWLRQEFIPELADSVFIIINSRQKPNGAWLTTPGWESLFREISLEELSEDESHEMLRLRGLKKSQMRGVNKFARGYPLALELASSAIRNQPDFEIIEAPPPKVLQHLTDSFLDGLPLEIKEAMEASSIVRRVTEPILRSLLTKTNVRKVFDELQELPFANTTDEGLILHDLVRETIYNSLLSRDPERHNSYRGRAWRYFNSESHRTEAKNLWQCTSDLLYMIENPGVRDAFFPKGASEFVIEPASLQDGNDICHIAEIHEPRQSALLIEKWWNKHPEIFRVVRDRDRNVTGYFILYEPRNVDPELLSEDTITASWMEHLNSNPVKKDEQILLLRRWLCRETGEAPCPSQAACWLDVKRSYMELRPNLRRIYTTVTNVEAYLPVVTTLGFIPIEEASINMDGITYYTAMLDFGESSVDGWLSRLVGAELGLEGEILDEFPEGTVTILFADIADSTLLTEKLSDDTFRALARELEDSLRKAIAENEGKMVEGKLLGDGVLAVFKSAHKAIEGALCCKNACKETDLQLHIGLHAGDVIVENNNVFGGAVNITSRIADISTAGEIVVSETVRSLTRTSAKVKFEDKGFYKLKGISDPHRLFTVLAP